MLSLSLMLNIYKASENTCHFVINEFDYNFLIAREKYLGNVNWLQTKTLVQYCITSLYKYCT